MKLKILYFAEARRIVKKNEEYVDFNGNTLSELKSTIIDKYPKVAEVVNSSIFAVNLQYAQLGSALKDGDTVAVIPPVEGG